MKRRASRLAGDMTRAVPMASPDQKAGEVLAALAGKRFDAMGTIFVVTPDGTLAGTVPLVRLCAAAPATPLSAAMQADPPAVTPETDRESAASLAIREELEALPVVDDTGRFLGALPPRAIMRILRREHLDDLHHMVGIWHHSEEARNALLAPPVSRARFRLPWLVLGLFGSMAAAGLVAQFETTLRDHIAIAFFIPAIVYLADAVGTQSEAVAVRGLSLTRMGIGRLLSGELATGVLIGLALALLSALFTLTAFGAPRLAAAVGLSLLAACAVASGIGLFLPWLFSRFRWDPALASGPIATVIQDVISLLIYFGAATAIV